MSDYQENQPMSVTKNVTKSETIKKANQKKAAMQNVGQKIAEFGVKNMEAGSKASSPSKKKFVSAPKTNIRAKEPTGKGSR